MESTVQKGREFQHFPEGTIQGYIATAFSQKEMGVGHEGWEQATRPS